MERRRSIVALRRGSVVQVDASAPPPTAPSNPPASRPRPPPLRQPTANRTLKSAGLAASPSAATQPHPQIRRTRGLAVRRRPTAPSNPPDSRPRTPPPPSRNPRSAGLAASPSAAAQPQPQIRRTRGLAFTRLWQPHHQIGRTRGLASGDRTTKSAGLAALLHHTPDDRPSFDILGTRTPYYE